ncbi:hypothetical protein AB5J51_39885 [Streptomyces sp. R33]|uniref:Core-binding (CB) domain-containing protein n=1 Tax=Streptomyces sp. R33 TaxID=3238629 RepID=A0AB39YFG3_9ACTN
MEYHHPEDRLPARHQTAWNWRRLAIWMHARGLGSLRSCDSKTLDRYGSFLLENGTARNTVHKALIALTRLWVFDGLGPSPLGVGRPPWDVHGVDDYLPPATSTQGGEKDGR